MPKEPKAAAANPLTKADVTDHGNVLEISFFAGESRRVVLYVRRNVSALVIEENGDILTGATFGKCEFHVLADCLRENKKIIDASNQRGKVQDGGNYDQRHDEEENQGIY